MITSEDISWVRFLPPCRVRVKYEWLDEREGEMDAQVEIDLGHPIWSPYWAENPRITHLDAGSDPAVTHIHEHVPMLARLHELTSLDPDLTQCEWRWGPKLGWQFLRRSLSNMALNGRGEPAAWSIWALRSGHEVELTETSRAVWLVPEVRTNIMGKPVVFGIQLNLGARPPHRVDILRRMRVARHIVLGDMAEELGLPVTELSKIESGKAPLTAKLVDLVEQVYDCSEEEVDALHHALQEATNGPK